MIIKRGAGPWRESYRPQSFAEFAPTTDLAGLKKHLASPDRSHTYMFVGETGTGKTTLARIIARQLNCTALTEDGPCLACQNCLAADSMVEELNMGYKTGVDESREIIDRVSVPPLIRANRVVILDEAHALSQAAQKAWLKVLEDPRPWLYVIFCTTDSTKFYDDVKNRCRQYKFTRLTKPEAMNFLTEIAINEHLTGPKVLDTKLAAALNDIYDAVGGRARELVEALQLWAESGKIVAPDETAKVEMKILVEALLSPARPTSQEEWKTIWRILVGLLESEKGSVESVRIKLVSWLWNIAANPFGYKQKFGLTRIMTVLEFLTPALVPPCEREQLACRIFRSWRSGSE